ncbi:hypothetical protein CEK25_003785 [Fusarium fujikuroi]|nr:hypothetical protein CEK25_003785 [Fusarium fujikuroi]
MGNTDAAAILDVCAYHRRDFDLVLIRSRPHENQVVQESIEKPFTTTPTVNLGALDILPNELLNSILRNLDLLSYFRFRRVNRRSRVLASELQEYKAVVRHGIEGFRGMLRARLATHFTFEDMYRALTTESCSFCAKFGGFLYLPTACRCCFACIENAPELRVISMSALAKLTKLSAKRLSSDIGYTLRTVPGIYSMEERTARRPALLLAEVEATRRLSDLGLLTSDTTRALEARSEQKNQRFMMSTAYPWYDPTTGQVENGVSSVINSILRLAKKQKLYSKRVQAEQGVWWNQNSVVARVISTHWIEMVYQDKRQPAMYTTVNNDRLYKF